VRRPAAALLGTLIGTVLIVGQKYATTSPATEAGATSDPGTTGDAAASGTPAEGPGTPGGPGSPALGARTAPSGSRPPATTTGPAHGTPPPGRTTTAPAVTCSTATGNAVNVASPGVGAITVSIRVCGGVLTTATGSQSRSNWDANARAVPALNSLAVRYYKTDISKVHYSGATLTSNAYQASLRSALTRGGI
jgi:uncharacterized protein with FMN-binding domain